MKDLVVVKCPVCGQEYLPSEIFLPNDFLENKKISLEMLLEK